MARRSKEELYRMERLVKNFLEDNNNNPHKAWDEYIKFYLTANLQLPNCIKGLKDFIKISEKYQAEYEYKIKLGQQKQENKQTEKDYQEIIWNLTKENDYPKVKELYKTIENQEKKMALCELMMSIHAIHTGDKKENYKFNASQIRIYKELNII
jgi:hypothetical protein